MWELEATLPGEEGGKAKLGVGWEGGGWRMKPVLLSRHVRTHVSVALSEQPRGLAGAEGLDSQFRPPSFSLALGGHPSGSPDVWIPDSSLCTSPSAPFPYKSPVISLNAPPAGDAGS